MKKFFTMLREGVDLGVKKGGVIPRDIVKKERQRKRTKKMSSDTWRPEKICRMEVQRKGPIVQICRQKTPQKKGGGGGTLRLGKPCLIEGNSGGSGLGKTNSAIA